jgi:hypothetical protein
LHLANEDTETEWTSKRGPGRLDEANPSLQIQIHNLESKVISSLPVRGRDVIDDTISSLGWFDRTKTLAVQDPGLWFGGMRLEGKKTFGAKSISDGTALHFEMCHLCQIFVALPTETRCHITTEVSLSGYVEVARRRFQDTVC